MPHFSNNNSTLILDSWTEFKKYIDGTYANLAYYWAEKGNIYTVITEEQGKMCFEITIIQDGGADHLDFENNFQNLVPRKPGTNIGIVNTTKILYDIQDTVIYVGIAQAGSATSASVWTIKKTSFDVNGSPISQLVSSTTAVWDDRTSETYS